MTFLFDCSLPVLLVLTFAFPPDFVVLLVEVAFSDRSAGRDVGVLEVVTTEAGYVKGTDFVYLVNDDQEHFRVQRNDKNCVCVQLILYSLDAPLVSAQRVSFGLLTKPFIVQMLRCIRWLHTSPRSFDTCSLLSVRSVISCVTANVTKVYFSEMK